VIGPIQAFAGKFGGEINLDAASVVKEGIRYYCVDESLRQTSKRDFFYAGSYLGKVKDGRFFPAFGLLKRMTEGTAARVIVDAKTEWLFVCGRDIFSRGIVKATGPLRKGGYVLVLNKYSECLGFGRLLQNVDSKKDNVVVVKNVLDVGDFLRRER